MRQHALLSAMAALIAMAPAAAQEVAIDADDIGGVVAGANGPEAGVWVIAETRDFPTTRYVKAVVTDAQGRYVLPDLPAATYSIWTRGYGLVDGPKVEAQPGQALDLEAVAAPTAAEAAQYYPAIYWYSMLEIPSLYPDHGPEGAQPVGLDAQNRWLNAFKNNGCVGCHQLGQASTRTIPQMFTDEFPLSSEAWLRRISAGQAGENMVNQVGNIDAELHLGLLAGWTDRIAAGELPATQPQRPYGVERNVVVTVWDWLDEQHYLHDLISTDRRNPTVNGWGKLYGAAELSTNNVPILDPVANVATTMVAPVRDKETPTTAEDPPLAASAYWGDQTIWDSQANMHNPMFDESGRVWFTHRIGVPANPDFCKEGSAHPSAQLTPVENAGRHLSIFDPATEEWTLIRTCFSTHHLQFDQNNMLWTSGGGPVVGWFDADLFEDTGDEAAAQGWTALILDTNGNGQRDAAVGPDDPVDPTMDKRINAGFYAVMPNPADGSVWGSYRTFPGAVVRLDPGTNPPETALAEIYNVPLPGFGIRGADIDRNGVVWGALASGHLASFDRRKCTGPLNGPTATGNHCPEGWDFYQMPGPGFAGLPDNSAESSYYAWVDQWNTLGLGENVPMVTGNLSDGLHALVDGKFVRLTVPYPMGFYAKGFDGRIDDPDAGWKGRGLWSTSGDRTPWLMEGGQGSRPLVVHWQLRPDPLAH